MIHRRTLFIFLAAVVSGTAGAANHPSNALVLNRPSVVALFAPDAELTKADREEPGFDDFIDDFQHYAQAVAAALHDNQNVSFYSSSLPTVSFTGGEHRPVARRSLSGYGFIVYVPGKTPVVFRGVATDDDVLCALKGLAPWLNVSWQCGPNESSAQQCSVTQAQAAERSVDSIDSWPTIYSAYRQYGHCDDGSIAEGFTDRVVHLLATRWDSLEQAQQLAARDPKFQTFIVRHIDTSASTSELDMVARAAKDRCPRSATALCTQILGAAIER